MSKSNINDSSHCPSWNDEDFDFGYQLDKLGIEKLFHTSEEVIIRELKVYIVDWGNKISRTKYNCRIPCFSQNMAFWIFTFKKLRNDSSLIVKNFDLRKMMAVQKL